MNTEITQQKRFICENCGNEHDGSYGSGRFCSKSCRCSFVAKKVKNRKIPQNKGKNCAPYGTWKCRVCGEILNTKRALYEHLHSSHPENVQKFHGKGSIPWNKGLTKETDERVAKITEKTAESYRSGVKVHPWKGKHHSAESKQKMSKSRIKFLAENPNEHPWKKSSKFVSIPCEEAKRQISSLGLLFQEEFIPLKERNFSIDIAFPDQKIGLEINGNQHYSDHEKGILSEYYQKRHELIESAGWKLIEIHYANVYHQDFLKHLLHSVGLV